VSLEVFGIDARTTTFEENILTFTGIEDSVTYEIEFVLTDFTGLSNSIKWEFEFKYPKDVFVFEQVVEVEEEVPQFDYSLEFWSTTDEILVQDDRDPIELEYYDFSQNG
jgi:hypothetical protein